LLVALSRCQREDTDMSFAEVAVDAPAGNRTFSYSVPPSLSVEPGHAVSVPFGPRNVAGIVFSVAEVAQVERTRDIVDLLHADILLRPHQLALAHWLTDTYMASLYEAASLMLPPAIRGQHITMVSLTAKGVGTQVESVPVGQRPVLAYLQEHPQSLQSALRRDIGGAAERQLPRLERSGLLERQTTWKRPGQRERFVSFLVTAPGLSEDSVADLKKGRARRQAALMDTVLTAGPPIKATEARRRFGASAVAGLLEKGLILEERIPVQSGIQVQEHNEAEAPPKLTGHQQRALAQISAALESVAVEPRSFLLHGVTGSGKTEVYLQALAQTLGKGKQGIILVPEISLTPQTLDRFNRRFPGRVVVVHSELTPAQRREAWWRLYRGEADIVVGSRSALFAPLSNPGLIVLDEEHEWTYKQAEGTPRYHAREAALELARLTGAVTVLGSATPDVVTYYQAQREKHRSLKLPNRIRPITELEGIGSMADVRIVDMRSELRAGNRSMFSEPLQEAVRRALDVGGQVILFLNRRGSSTHVQCRDCGHSVECRSCATPMTYHGDRQRLLCHHCGRMQQEPSACPVCQSRRIRYLGVGTQRVLQEAQELFPDAEAVRWDRDVSTISGQRDLVLNKFIRGEAHILVGTQMVTKGLHIPNVMLVGVMLADLGLYIPDFRAQERVFQLLCQVAGRAGRGALAGEGIIQTYQPDNYAVQAAASQDYEAFFEQEIAFRRSFRYPPFSRLAKLTYSHTDAALSEGEAERLCRVLLRHQRAIGDTESAVIGPAPGYPARLRGKYRWHVVLRSPDPAGFLSQVELTAGWVVDIDPVSVS